MFGLVSPCSHSSESSRAAWRAHLCGLCLGLRDTQGQAARLTTNTDAVLLSILTEAQTGGAARRTAGPCALRGMRTAEVATADSPGVRLAATASLLLGSATVSDKIADGDGPFKRRYAAAPAQRLAHRWRAAAQRSATEIGLDATALLDAIESQGELERNPAGRQLTDFTAPAELCASTLFGHSAVLAKQPANVEPLRVIGTHFGRIAHLADAVEDYAADAERGAFNPLAASGTDMRTARQLLHRSHRTLRKALTETSLHEDPVVHRLLVNDVDRAINKAFGETAGPAATALGQPLPDPVLIHPGAPPHTPPGRDPWQRPPRRPPLLKGLAICAGVYCTGAACCTDHTNPCNGQQEPAWWKDNAGDCADCCSNCGDCCSCGGDGGCCSGCCDGCGCDCSC